MEKTAAANQGKVEDEPKADIQDGSSGCQGRQKVVPSNSLGKSAEKGAILVVGLEEESRSEPKTSSTSAVKTGGRRSSGLMTFDDNAAREHVSWARREVETLLFVALFALLILPLTILFARLAVTLANDSGAEHHRNSENVSQTMYDFNVTNTSEWFGYSLSECQAARQLEQDVWLIIYFLGVGCSCNRFALSCIQSHFLFGRNVWTHTFIGLVFVTLAGSLIAHASIGSISSSSAGLIFYSAFIAFSYNIAGDASRRLAQYLSSKHRKRAQRLAQNIFRDAAGAALITFIISLSGFYLIASERTSGSIDILINGVLYPAACAGVRMLFHKINQSALTRKQYQDDDRLLEVAGLTSSLIELCFSIPAFFVFLRIGDWNTFFASAILSFMVEFGGVYWVTKGNQVFRQVQTRLSSTRSVREIVAKAESALTEVDFDIDNRAAMVLASKIVHEEHCEKLSLWVSILITLLTSAKWTSDLLLQMLVLVCLETAVDQVKLKLCETRGIPVRLVRPHLRGNPWFVLTVALGGIGVSVALLFGMKLDCFLFGYN